MAIVNDSPPSPLTPQEIEEWRKEKKLKQEMYDLQAELSKAQTEWMAHRGKADEGEYVKKFNSISCKLELKRQEIREQ